MKKHRARALMIVTLGSTVAVTAGVLQATTGVANASVTGYPNVTCYRTVSPSPAQQRVRLFDSVEGNSSTFTRIIGYRQRGEHLVNGVWVDDPSFVLQGIVVKKAVPRTSQDLQAGSICSRFTDGKFPEMTAWKHNGPTHP